jgi:hypothetical protein
MIEAETEGEDNADRLEVSRETSKGRLGETAQNRKPTARQALAPPKFTDRGFVSPIRPFAPSPFR